MNRLRLAAKPVASKQKEAWIQEAVDRIFKASESTRAILFGSALGAQFDDQSDLDFVVLFEDERRVREGSSVLHRQLKDFPCQVDLVCVTEAEFAVQSKIGGVLFVARAEGREFKSPRSFER